MSDFTNFLGKGWSFPPKFDHIARHVETRENEMDIDESLFILLTTVPGERVLVPDFGCNLEDLLFQPLNLTVITYMIEKIKTSILYHEPRIDVEKIDISESNILEGEIRIQIDYKVRATNSRRNFVFPFYKGEGSLKN